MLKTLTAALVSVLFILALLLPGDWSGAAQTRWYTIQTSSKETEEEARLEASKLAAAGYPAHWLKAEVKDKGTRFRVRVGRFSTQAEAKNRADQAVKAGLIAEYIITVYETPTATVAARKPTPTPAPATTVSETKPAAPEPKIEKKPEPVVEPPPREVKPSKVAVIPIKPASNEPGSEPPAATNEPKTDKITPAPVIAEPPMAEALGEVDFTNRNWKVVRKSTATDKNLRSVFFIDSMTGWTAGDAGALHRTTDGGKTWKPLLAGAPATITQIQFIDWNTGWLLGEQTRKDDEMVETIVLSTTNGGRSWTKKSLPNIQGIWFTDAQKGWAVGKNATILQTFDGGNEWKPYPDTEKLIGLPVESSNYNFGFREIFFLDAQNGWLIGNFYGRTANNIGGLFATNDGGVTWRRVPFTVQTQYSSGRFTPGQLQTVRFVDTNVGSLSGEMNDGEGRFFFSLQTRDGGKTWEQFRTPSRAAHSSQFLGTGLGWTAASAMREGGADAKVFDTTLMRTDNGGASWRHDFVARGSRIHGVFFLSPQRGWAVGDRGMILRYEEKTRTN